MSDIVQTLRDLADCKHSDLSAASEAAEKITRLRAEVDALKADLDSYITAANEYMREGETLRAEVERLRVQSIQMQAALGYGILAEDERHILPSNPFKCGTCDASKHLRAENERLRAALTTARPFIGWAGSHPTILAVVDAALEEKP